MKKFGSGETEESKEKTQIAKKIEKIRSKLNHSVTRIINELYKLS